MIMLCRSTIRDKIIPHAVSWFTGEAIQEDEFGDIEDDDEEDDVEEEDDDEEEDDEEEEDDDDDEEDEEESKPKKKVGILLMWPDFILFIIYYFVFKTDANHYLSYCFGMLLQSSAGHKVCYLFSCFLHFHYRLPLPLAPFFSSVLSFSLRKEYTLSKMILSFISLVNCF